VTIKIIQIDLILKNFHLYPSPDISWIAKVTTPGWCVRNVLVTGLPGYSQVGRSMCVPYVSEHVSIWQAASLVQTVFSRKW